MSKINSYIALINENVKTPEDYKAFTQALRHKYADLLLNTAFNFRYNDRVKFKGKRGELITGNVIKVNAKTVKVLTDSKVTWVVTPTLLSKIDNIH